MSDTPSLDRVRLRALAEQATPGPWYCGYGEHGRMRRYWFVHADMAEDALCDLFEAQPDGEFVVAFNPVTALSLLDAADERDRLAARVEQMTEALRELGKHGYGCPGRRLAYPDDDDCTCGLAAALKGSNP